MSQPHRQQQRGKLMRSHLTVSLPWNPPSLKVFARPFCGITSEGFVPSSQSGPSLPRIAAIIHRSKEASRISGCGFKLTLRFRGQSYLSHPRRKPPMRYQTHISAPVTVGLGAEGHAWTKETARTSPEIRARRTRNPARQTAQGALEHRSEIHRAAKCGLWRECCWCLFSVCPWWCPDWPAVQAEATAQEDIGRSWHLSPTSSSYLMSRRRP